MLSALDDNAKRTKKDSFVPRHAGVSQRLAIA
jgi:hypothetical protein